MLKGISATKLLGILHLIYVLKDLLKKKKGGGVKTAFSNGFNNVISNSDVDVFDLELKADAIYIDSPYISSKGNRQWRNIRHKKIKNAKSEKCEM
jgi:hypothetical protein